jgi:hypothetical protein
MSETMMSQEIDKLFDALVKAQMVMKVAPKESSNPFFKSKYADLQTVWETIKEPLSKNNLCVVQTLMDCNDHSALVTILAHASGQWIKSVTPIPLVDKKVSKEGVSYEETKDAQKFCSSVTYFRRMALAAITGCYAGEADDDGNSTISIKEEHKAHPSAPTALLIGKAQAAELELLCDGIPSLRKNCLDKYKVSQFTEIPAKEFVTIKNRFIEVVRQQAEKNAVNQE